jgi:hypothetical protein
MNKQEQAEAAAVLKALTKGWDLVDYAPEINFLIFANEDREELDFYPKKSLIRMMEHSGLIENLDTQRSSVREPYTHYEAHGSLWKEITEAGFIVFRYRITSKGQKFLHDAPRLIGRTVRPLRVASSPIEMRAKPLKVVIYDKQAIQKLVEDFESKAKMQIDSIFSSSLDTDLRDSFRPGVMCGRRLWQKLKSQAERNGLQPVSSLVGTTYSLGGGNRMSTVQVLEDVPLSSAGEMQLFVKTLREVFSIKGPLAIRRAEVSEASAYAFQEQTNNDDPPPPNLAGLTVNFVVEANQSKFMVLVESLPEGDINHFGPAVRWIELMDGERPR